MWGPWVHGQSAWDARRAAVSGGDDAGVDAADASRARRIAPIGRLSLVGTHLKIYGGNKSKFDSGGKELEFLRLPSCRSLPPSPGCLRASPAHQEEGEAAGGDVQSLLLLLLPRTTAPVQKKTPQP